jgi:hypothetical protein
MKNLKKIVVATVIAASGLVLLPARAHAAEDEAPAQHGFVHGEDFYAFRMEHYRDLIMRMSPDDRSKLMAMQDKVLQMEMDKQSAVMKMDMEITKMKRDMEFFVLRSAVPTQSGR